MELFHKIKNTVNSALPGNPLFREYEVGDQIGSAGVEFLWKIFTAKKKSTKQTCSIWLLEKSSLDSYGKNEKEFIIGQFRKGAINLAKIRHPKILSVLATLEESRESLVFVTEPVLCSLGNVLFMRRNLPFNIQEELDSFRLNDIEKIYGVSNIIEAILFLHRDIKSVHCNISPQSIIINEKGCWKLAGLDFLTKLDEIDQISFGNIQSGSPASTHPFLKYSAPESVMENRYTFESDMFSFGMVIYSIYNNGKSYIECGDNYFDYKNGVERLKTIQMADFMAMPESLRKYCMLMIDFNPNHRPDPYQIINLPYFENAGVRALQKLDSLFEMDKLGKSEFFKTLSKQVPNFSRRMNVYKLFPQLTEEFVDCNMIPFVLETILSITEIATDEEFQRIILPKLGPVFRMKEPIQITFILLQNLRILLTKFKREEFNIHILPIISSALATENQSIQELCLKSLPEIGDRLEFATLKGQIFPKLKTFYQHVTSMKMKLMTLTCMGKLLENVDKWTIVEDLIPFLGSIRTRDQSINMAIYAIFRVSAYHKRLGFNSDELALKVLPILIPLSVNSSLTLRQHKAFSRLIRALCLKLETLHEMKMIQSGNKSDGSEMINLDETENKEIDNSSEAMDYILGSYLQNHESPMKAICDVNKPKALTLEEKLNARSLPAIEGPSMKALNPTTKPLALTHHEPVDLTAKLMDRNLNFFSTTQQSSFQPVLMQTRTDYFNTSPQKAMSQPTQAISLSQKDIDDFLS